MNNESNKDTIDFIQNLTLESMLQKLGYSSELRFFEDILEDVPLRGPRQSGRSTSTRVYVLYENIVQNNISTAFLVPYNNIGMDIIYRCKRDLEDLGLGFLISSSNKNSITLKNGNIIFFEIMTKNSLQVRSCNYIVIEEGIDSKNYKEGLESIAPSTSYINGKIIKIGYEYK